MCRSPLPPMTVRVSMLLASSQRETLEKQQGEKKHGLPLKRLANTAAVLFRLQRLCTLSKERTKLHTASAVFAASFSICSEGITSASPDYSSVHARAHVQLHGLANRVESTYDDWTCRESDTPLECSDWPWWAGLTARGSLVTLR